MMAQWKATYIHREADADRIAGEIMALADRSTRNIVEMAKDPATESYKCFEWDPEKNIEMSLLNQARQMVDHLVITVEIQRKDGQVQHVVVNQFTSISRRYEVTLSEDEEVRQQIFEEVSIAFRAAKRKYEAHKALFTAAQMREIQEFIEQIA